MNSHNLKLDHIIDRGVFAIKNLQLPDGSFSDTNFYTGLILCSLSEINHPEILKLQNSVQEFLLSQHSSSYTFNYWKSPRTPLSKKIYPDDLDDTSVCLSALSVYDESFVDEEVLFSFVTTLIETEEQPGGPYNTWIVPDYKNTNWYDIDLGVNINIGYFLNLQNIHLTNLVSFIETRIKDDDFTSKYYHKKISLIYFLSRWYRGELVEHLKTVLLTEFLSNPLVHSSQDIAQAISAYTRFGGPLEHILKAIDYLIDNQCPDGTWDPDSFFIEEVVDGVPYYSELRAFATACALEAVSLHKIKLSQSKQESCPASSFALLDKKIKDTILLEQHHLPSEIQKQLEFCISKVTHYDKKYEVTLLPYFFYRSLKNKPIVSDEIIFQLCKASLYGWIAYTLYDDIMDKEPKQHLIPLANICMRNLVSIYTHLGASDLVTEILEMMECANFYEHYDHCVDVNNLGHKSFGHALAPILITRLSNNSEHEKDIRDFFNHYLIARQLNDDAHDWLEDLRHGFINPAGSLVLEKYKSKFPDTHLLDLMEDSSDVLILKRIFWESVIDEISEKIVFHTDQARMVLSGISNVIFGEYLLLLLEPMESSARTALLKRNSTKKMLSFFK